MHYCVALFTESLPDSSKIEELMKPFSLDNLEYDEEDNRIGNLPLFTYDYYLIGGRFSGNLKLNMETKNSIYEFGYYAREPRNGRVFHSYALSKIEELKKTCRNQFMYNEEDFMSSMGATEHFLYVDGAKISDLIGFESFSCYCCVGENGSCFARESWDGEKFIRDDNYDTEYEQLRDSYKNGFVTILDIHG